ncbi:hypothetical protein N015_06065 [Pseudomonas asturiensis]|uniref:Uncharacterized protein n=1 Tax=Pseudomonas asturiensis TaxID=1190415 RepID=A0ABX6H8X6_9PSED|nr:hypothetical protein N015_06065 [Pseudomonas asturiensis]
MAVINFSAIRCVDPFQGASILLENDREYKVQARLHTNAMPAPNTKKPGARPGFLCDGCELSE